jgi:hypothetical protein
MLNKGVGLEDAFQELVQKVMSSISYYSDVIIGIPSQNQNAVKISSENGTDSLFLDVSVLKFLLSGLASF